MRDRETICRTLVSGSEPAVLEPVGVCHPTCEHLPVEPANWPIY